MPSSGHFFAVFLAAVLVGFTSLEPRRNQRVQEEENYVPSFSDMVNALSKWGRMYLRTPQGGETVLLVSKLHPSRRNDHRWVVVRPNRRVRVVDTRDRSTIRARKEAGVNYTAFQPLTRVEKQAVEDLAKELQLEKEQSSFPQLGKGLQSLISAVGGALSWSTMGTTGLGLFLLWRIASYFKVIRGCSGRTSG